MFIVQSGPRKSSSPSGLHVSLWYSVVSMYIEWSVWTVGQQEAATFNNFYDGISCQHMATVLIPVFTLCYARGLLFRGPPYRKGTRGSAVGWGTALQAGRPRIRFRRVSLGFFIDINLPAALWPLGSTQSLTEMSTRKICLGVKAAGA
jgi:hypothetical protein